MHTFTSKMLAPAGAHIKIYPQQVKTSIFKFTSGNYRTHILNAAKSYSNEN